MNVGRINDSPINRTTIEQLTDDQLDEFIDGMRERRMRVYRHYEEAKKLEKEMREGRLRERLAKHLELLEKELNRITRALDKIDERVVKIRALRLEIEG